MLWFCLFCVGVGVGLVGIGLGGEVYKMEYRICMLPDDKSAKRNLK